MDSTYSLYELADKNFLTIPDLQRGLVWNAARIESLWDSIVRGIPIGAISVRNGEVFDGQQRRHAIQVGLNYDPTHCHPIADLRRVQSFVSALVRRGNRRL